MSRINTGDGIGQSGDQVLGQQCPGCARESVVYDGNYFCLREDGTSCGWSMSEPIPGIIKAYLRQR